MMKIYLILLVILGIFGCFALKSKEMCENSFSLFCAKIEIGKYIEELSKEDELEIFDGIISVVKNENVTENWNSKIVSELSRMYPDEPERRLDGFLTAKFLDYLKNHSIKFKLVNEKFGQERKGKIGKKGGLETLIAAGMMMKGKEYNLNNLLYNLQSHLAF